MKIEIRWADLDPNVHVLHSKYYDFGASCRVAYFVKYGLTPGMLKEHHFGPVLLREECTFRRELKFGDEVTIDLNLTRMTADLAHWSMRHLIYKNDNKLAATINIDAAWIDTQKRKLIVPPQELTGFLQHAPKSADFHLFSK